MANIDIKKEYYHETVRGADGIDRVNVNVMKYFYKVSFQGSYFEYENLEELKQNILADILKLQEKVKTLEKVK